MTNSPAFTESSPHFAAVTASDTAYLKYEGELKKCRAIYIGSIAGGATLTVKNEAGTSVQFAGLVAGTWLPIQTDRVMSTGTLASSIVALF